MSITPLAIDNFENYTIKTHTHRHFSSASSGVEGDLSLFPRGSTVEKDLVPAGEIVEVVSGSILATWQSVTALAAGGATNIKSGLETYFASIEGTEPSKTKLKRVSIIRFEPSYKFTKDTGRKNTVKNILFPYYAGTYSSCKWAYPNYHTINFFTASSVPSDSALIYPSPSGRFSPAGPFTFEFWINPRYTTDGDDVPFQAGTILHLSSSYAISLVSGSSVDANGRPDAFRVMLQLSHSAEIPPSDVSLENPRGGPVDGVASDLIYLSSDNCLKKDHWHHVAIRWGGIGINLGSGSFVIDGKVDENFCIPSSSLFINDSSGLFVGNFFEQKSEAGVVARFFNASTAYAEGLESFFPDVPPAGLDYIDLDILTPAGVNTNIPLTANITFKNIPFPGTEFEFSYGPAASPQLTTIQFVNTAPGEFEIDVTGLSTTEDCAAAFSNKINSLPALQGYFESESNSNVVTVTGFRRPVDVIKPIRPEIDCTEPSSEEGSDDPTVSDPPDSAFDLRHSLNAEVHEIRIFNVFRDVETIRTESTRSFERDFDNSGLIFYLPPYFTSNAPERDVLQTPFQSFRTTTNDPFNVALSFGVGGRELNLPNFLKEFTRGCYPRLYKLKSLETAFPVGEPTPSNDILYAQPSFRRGNLTILPNDNGLFYPSYAFMTKNEESTAGFASIEGVVDYSMISLENMVDMSNIAAGAIDDDDLEGAGFFLSEVASPEDPGLAPGDILTVLNRTRDPSSNEVVFFDASNLYYGNSIKPGTYELVDRSVTGSEGKVSIKLSDNRRGGLYRSNCATRQAAWNEVGTLMYSEGISVVKTPNIPFFGKDAWDLDFDGDHNVYVLEINVPCAKGQLNSSSNPDWKELRASSDANLVEDQFVYITGLNLHDENFNVVARVNLAQPVVKKESDKYLFRAKIDF